MSWARLDDSLFSNPKFVNLNQGDKLLYLASICFSAAGRTDGHVTSRALPILLAQSEATPDGPFRLLSAGLWDQGDSDSYWVHDYLEYNPSRDEIDASREKKRTAGKRGGQASAQARATPPAEPDAQAPPQALSRPVPSTEVLPSSSSSADPRETAAARILAQRDLDRATLNESREPIRDRNRWLKVATDRRHIAHAPMLILLCAQNPAWTAEQIAAAIEPAERTGRLEPWTPRIIEGALPGETNANHARSLRTKPAAG